jgi:hypothetical protein
VGRSHSGTVAPLPAPVRRAGDAGLPTVSARS